MRGRSAFIGVLWAAVASTGCADAPEGLAEAREAEVTVKFDFDHRPLPDIPLPNDIAMRPDPSSATGRRINASMIAPTQMEMRVRTLVDQLDGWGLQQPITIPFTAPIDIESVLAGHRDVDYETSDDVIYLVDIDRESPHFGRIHHLDVGNGNYPWVLEDREMYGPADPRNFTLTVPFEEADEDRDRDGEFGRPEVDADRDGRVDPDEDKNGNGYLDPPEDEDADGVLDSPNYLPGRNPAADDLAGRADALMSFYEEETNTLIAAPMVPLRERTRYAVVVTRRILDLDGNPIGSPFEFINHTAQTDDLEALPEVLPEGLELEDVAFAFSFTTQTAESAWISVRDGLYGHGVQKHIAEQFPPRLDGFLRLKDTSIAVNQNQFLMYHEEWASLFQFLMSAFFGVDPSSQQGTSTLQAHRYVDYHAMVVYESPQLFDVYGPDGKRLPLENQSWPQDLHDVPAPTRGEKVYVWIVMPRKEVSKRAQGEHVPVMLLGHGYQSNRISETLGFAGFLAQFGIATIAIDNVHHGLGFSPDDVATFGNALRSTGLEPVADAVGKNRAEDLDKDGIVDSGAEFWTAYTFHTRDVMRQSALDYMQLIRILRTWDGETTWEYGPEGDGPRGIAGDFDGDGVVDIGKNSSVLSLGGSLGGIMSTILGGAEPEVEAVIPIAGGGRLTDVGARTMEGGVPEAVVLRVMGAVYYADLAADGLTRLYAYATELNHATTLAIAEIPGLFPGDTFVARNLDNGEVGCGYMLPVEGKTDGTGREIRAQVRVHVASDIGDRTNFEIYRGPALVAGSTECEIEAGFEPVRVVDRRDFAAVFEGETHPPGELRSFVEGLGLRRANPEIRRFLSIGQLVIDPADPAVFARHFNQEPLHFPGTGQTVDTRALIVTTVGDMQVPANTGTTVGRAAGYIDYLEPDPRYEGTPYEGLPPNQILIDTYTVESVNVLERFTMPGDDGTLGVHMDIENFSGGTDLWGDALPRLDPPLRLVSDEDAYGNELDGFSGAVFAYSIPQGQHGFALPGGQTDEAIAKCQNEGKSDEECDALVGEVFDVGWFMFHSFGRFLRGAGKVYPFLERCNTLEQCNDLPPPPPERALADLR